jgi:acetate kinase
MGLTPLSGLPGATRAGNVDPSLVFHYTHDAGKMSSSSSKDLHVTAAEEILNKKCGWKAMTGTSDFGEIIKRAKQAKNYEDGDNGAAKLAFDLFIDRIVCYVGSYYLKLGGKVDALVFAGGVGERSTELREAVVSASACLGLKIDGTKKVQVGGGDSEVVADISASDTKIRVLVCHTDEQEQMAIAVNELEARGSASDAQAGSP